MTNRFLSYVLAPAFAIALLGYTFFANGAANTGSTLLGATGDASTIYHFETVGAGTTTPLNGLTNNIARATTNTYNLSIKVRNYGDFLLEAQWSLNTTGTGTNVFSLQKSADNIVWYDAGQFTGTNNGTNVVGAITNITAGSYGYWRLTTVGNTNAAADITNLTARTVYKPYRYGNFHL